MQHERSLRLTPILTLQQTREHGFRYHAAQQEPLLPALTFSRATMC